MQPLSAEVGNSGGFGGSSGGFSSGGFGSGFGSFFFFGDSPLLFFLMIAFFVYSAYRRSTKVNAEKQTQSRFNTSFLDEEKVVSDIQVHDPNFSAAKFKAYVGEVYLTLQDAWEAKQWKNIRVMESDALFNMHNRQIQEFIDKGWTNYMERQDVRKVEFAAYTRDDNYEVLVVRLQAALIDYTKADENGKLIDGSETILQERSYRLEFIRKKGVLSNVAETVQVSNCPNCGAPNALTSAGECEYCHSLITNGEYGWILNKYGAWNASV